LNYGTGRLLTDSLILARLQSSPVTSINSNGIGEIRTQSRRECIFCGSAGISLYANLEDRLFGTHGTWGFRQCPESACGLIWLDPAPIPADLPKAYASYYTHVETHARGHSSGLKQYCKRAQNFYVQSRYCKGKRIGSALTYYFGALIHSYLTEGSSTFLKPVPNGKLLDVGCGSGQNLALMREVGWRVEGVESDPQAVKAAQQNGLTVHCATVEERAYPAHTFDAVVLCHVIEHLQDPASTIRECARILKPGGQLMIFTPNSASLGHRLFGNNWRGLEPPRHLFLFATASMKKLLKQCGFNRVSIRPQVGSSVLYDSFQLWRKKRGPFGSGRTNKVACAFARAFALFEMGIQGWSPDQTDCLGVLAEKPVA
jgi:2-polyprenyl-3-methyl-5-hydroxy-6-metoxy-1,4-benzoquinol methylase